METEGGGWIVIQRRNVNFERVNFTRNWEDYVNGFGDLNGEFWIGLNNINQLTSQQNMELQITVWNNEIFKTWNYQTFLLFNAASKSTLFVSGGSGDSGYYTFQRHNGYPFSTYDRDNDGYRYNCAYQYQGGWWYRNGCTSGNLNGRHERSGLPGTSTDGQLLTWDNIRYNNSVMMIRSKTCGLGI